MKKIDVLNKAIGRALKNGFDWDIDYDDWEELSDLEKVLVLREIVNSENNVYLVLIFDHAFAKALWGDSKYMAFYAGYEEWADATEPEPTWAEFDQHHHDRMPLFEYHLMMMARAEDRLKYLGDNLPKD